MTKRRWLMLGVGGRRGPADRRPRRWPACTRTISGTSRSARPRSGARVSARSRRCVSAPCSRAGLFAFGNLYAVRQSVVSLVFPRRIGNLEIGEEVPGRYLMGDRRRPLRWCSAFCSRFRNRIGRRSCSRCRGGGSRRPDPYFDADLGFFVYWLPLENTLWTWAFLYDHRRHRHRDRAVRADAEPQMAARIALRIDVRATPFHGARGRAAAHARLELSPRHVRAVARRQRRRRRVQLRRPPRRYSGQSRSRARRRSAAALIVLWAGFVGQLRLAGIAVLSVIGLSLVVREVAPRDRAALGNRRGARAA